MSRGLAYRRWRAEQAKLRTRRMWSDWGMFQAYGPDHQWPEEDIQQWVVRMAVCSNKPCSRPQCCGNPRRFSQLTLQERRQNLEPERLNPSFWQPFSGPGFWDNWFDDYYEI